MKINEDILSPTFQIEERIGIKCKDLPSMTVIDTMHRHDYELVMDILPAYCGGEFREVGIRGDIYRLLENYIRAKRIVVQTNLAWR